MRAWMYGAIIMVVAGAAVRVFAEDVSPGPPGWLLNGGVSYFKFDPSLPNDLVMHTTHPDDRAFMSGSPGNTPLTEVEATLLNLSLERTWSITKQPGHGLEWGLGYTLKVPLEETGRMEKQNDNDTRPPTEGSFIYTTLVDLKPAHEVEISLHYWWETDSRLICTLSPSFNVGYWKMTFEKGWDRFGQDQAEQSSDAKGLALAPQVEFSVGTRELKLAVLGAYRFMDLKYDTSTLGSAVAQGWEVGASVGWHF